MPQDRFNLNVRAALLAAIAAAYPVIGYTAPAAQVDFAVGNVTAVGSNGQSRALGKGAQVEQGDTVNTNGGRAQLRFTDGAYVSLQPESQFRIDQYRFEGKQVDHGDTVYTNGGRAQLRFTDGAYVSLQPESQFRIDQYRFEGKQDGNEKGFFSLLKGGLRTITGLVGRSNKKNYQVSTSVATIGIRGTEYTLQYGHSVTGTVGEGEINVCNGAGCLSVTNGESYYVQNQDIKPVLTNKRTDLPPPEPTNPPTNFTQGNNVDSSGNPIGFLLTGTPTPISVGRVTDLPNITSNFGAATLDTNGVLTNLNGELLSNVVMSGNDGIIAWGTGFSASGGETIHFVIGIPTPASDLANLAISNPIGTYSLIGGTSPTIRDSNSGTTVSGTLTGATLTANFATMLVDASVAMKFNVGSASMALSAAGTGMSISTFSGSTFSGFFCASNSCTITGGTCSTTSLNMQGFFAGPNAIRAGLVYEVGVSGTTGPVAAAAGTSINGTAIGAAAFAKK